MPADLQFAGLPKGHRRGRALPVAQSHAAGGCLIPVANGYIRVEESEGPLLMHLQCFHRCRPNLIAPFRQTSRNQVCRLGECLIVIVVYLEFLGAAGKPVDIGRYPLELIFESWVVIKIAMQDGQKIQHVFGHLARHICFLVPEHGPFRRNDIVEQMQGRQ